MTDARRFWEAVYGTFDPEVGVRDPALFTSWPRAHDPLARIERRLRLGNYKGLLTGRIGNGKSSSLYNLGSRLIDERLVVLADLHEYAQNQVRDPAATTGLDPSELLIIVGLAILRVGDEQPGHDWGAGREAFNSLARLDGVDDDASFDLPLLTNAAAASLGSGLIEVAGRLAGRSFFNKVRSPPTQETQAPPAGRLLDAVNDLVAELESSYGRRLLLLIDGLDRIERTETLDALFNSSLIFGLHCDAVFVVSRSFLGYRGLPDLRFDVVEVPNLPVLDRQHPDEPNKPGPGLPFFTELTERRLAAVRSQVESCDDPLPAPAIARFAHASGGVVRRFIKMIRQAAEQAWDREVSKIDDAIVDEVLQVSRRAQTSGLTRDELTLLREVMNDPDHLYPDNSHAHALSERGCLLAYSDDTVWYYPHPLLIPLLRPRAPEPRERLHSQQSDDQPVHGWALSLHDWRRFERVEFSADGVCLLAGPNGSGKSSILEAFDFLRNVADRGVMEACRLAKGGHFLRRLGAKPSDPVIVELELGPLRWRVELAIEGQGVHPNHGESLFYDGRPIFDRKLYATEWVLGGRTWDASHSRSSLRVALDSNDYELLEPLSSFLSSVRVYPPVVLRDIHGADQRLARTASLDRDASNLVPLLNKWKTASRRYGDRFEWILEHMRQAFPDQVHDMEFSPDGQAVRAFVYPPNAAADQPMPLHLVADGVLTGLVHLAAAAGAERGTLIAIDELENHLHPQAIRAILGALREIAELRDCTIVVTTHSPVLMNEFKGHEDQLFVLEPGAETTPRPLDEIEDPNWLAHFDLGDLYGRLKFAAPRRRGE